MPPTSELVVILFGNGVQVTGALLFAGVLIYFARTGQRNYLTPWIWSWVAFAVFTATALVSRFPGPDLEPESTARTAASVVSLTAGYLHLIWLSLGTWEFLRRRRLTSRWVVASVGAAAGLALVLSAVGVSDPEAGNVRFFARTTVHAIAAGGVFFVLGIWLLPRRDSGPGGRVLPVAMLLYGFDQLMIASWSSANPTPLADPWVRTTVAYVDVFLLLLIGVGMLLWMLDVEARERTDAWRRLADSEERFRSLAERATDAIITVNEDARVVFASPGATRVFGWTQDELLGRPVTDLMPDAQRQPALAALRLSRKAGGIQLPGDGFSAMGLRKSGEAFPVEMTLTEHAVSGQRQITGIIRDVTERQRAEEQARHSQRMEAVGRLAGGVAHDFNNLLAAVKGSADLAIEALPRDHAVLEHVRDIQHAADRAAQLTGRLLSMSQLRQIAPVCIDLNTAVTDMTQLLDRIIGDDILVTLDLASEPVLVDADPGMIDQVLLNLAINARDAMPDGGELTIATGGELRAVDADGQPAPESRRFGLLRVTDTGVGISRANLPNIFDPFFTTKDVGQGSGLGLATIYGMVRQHGGVIEVESAPGQGASFRVLLPASSGRRAEPPARPARAVAAAASGETLLLVEDDPQVRRVFKRALQGAGYVVIEAANGPEALEVWLRQSGEIALVITDVIMPGGLTGSELVARLRHDSPTLPILLISGYHDQEVDLQDDRLIYLAKPFSTSDLKREVRALLGRR